MKKPKLYRIYTENRNKSLVALRASEYLLPGYTLIAGIGYWRGKPENSLILEYVSSDGNAREKIRDLAREIKALNGQEAVMIIEQAARIDFV